jgi:hypothetical protein
MFNNEQTSLFNTKHIHFHYIENVWSSFNYNRKKKDGKKEEKSWKTELVKKGYFDKI